MQYGARAKGQHSYPCTIFYLYPLNLSQSKHRECLHGTCPYKLTCLLWPGYFIGLHSWPVYLAGLLHRPAKQKWIETCQGYIIWLHPKIKSKSSCHLFSLGWTRICKTYDSSIQPKESAKHMIPSIQTQNWSSHVQPSSCVHIHSSTWKDTLP